jgi:hypothetical protein
VACEKGEAKIGLCEYQEYRLRNMKKKKNEKTPSNRILPEKMTVSQLVNKFPASYGTRTLITVK